MTPAIVFDDGLGPLTPLTDLRGAFDIRTGALTTLERLARRLDLEPIGLAVPEAIAPVVREAHALPVNEPPARTGAVLLVNGRCVLPPDSIRSLAPGHALLEPRTGALVAARVTTADAPRVLAGDRSGLEASESIGPMLITRPWQVIGLRDQALAIDLQLLAGSGRAETPPGVTAFGSHALTIASGARFYPGVFLDLESGPIYIDHDVVVRPGAILCGPLFLGRATTVLEHAVVRKSAIGPHCKVAGEVSGSIFQAFSNKAHDGHLGDSWIGEWVNLGAGTTNSNLLNTYSEVVSRAQPGGQNERTGLQFLGALIGDHTKTGIGTRLMTGAVVGTGAMHAATAPMEGAIPAFSWTTDAGRREYRHARFVETARAMMSRRRVTPSDAYLARLALLHETAPPAE